MARNAVRGPRGYRALAEADPVRRAVLYRGILIAQFAFYVLPAIAAIGILRRGDALVALPEEFWTPSFYVTGGMPAIEPQWTWVGAAILAILAAVTVGSALTWRRTRQGKGPPASIAHIAALLPRNRTELKLCIAISLAAGVGEELFFRLLLPVLLAAFIDPLAAVGLAILLFGMGHAYQGWKGLLITSALGAVLMHLYLFTGSLIVPILFHAMIDLMTLAIRPAIRGAWAKAA